MRSRAVVPSFFTLAFALVLAATPGALATPCSVPDNGTGTVNLPPVGCAYLSPDEVHVIIAGLPPGTQINLGPMHHRFLNPTYTVGGSLGGEIETFSSEVLFQITGTGDLATFSRTLTVPLLVETHTGPRTLGNPVQSFDTDMFRMQGALAPGDPDFCTLSITAGTNFGLPSPGHTTLTRVGPPGTNFVVDSFFDITYRIDFTGCPGSQLGGFSGSTTATIRMRAGEPAGTCPPIAAATDAFASTAKLVIEPLFGPGSDPFVVRLSSASLPDSVVQRGPQVGNTIDTELVSLSLSGNHPLTGPLQIQLNPAFPSLGAIENIQRDAATCRLTMGDSFFDVFVSVQVGGETWINTGANPIRIGKRIMALPPIDFDFETPTASTVQLVEQSTLQPRARVRYVGHRFEPKLPPPGQDCLGTWFDALLTIPGLGIFNNPIGASGPTTVQRGAPFSSGAGACSISGGPCTTNPNCPPGETCLPLLDTIQTEIVQMDLVSAQPHPILGDYFIHVRPAPPLPPSQGQVRSLSPAQQTYLADSFFDVFVDVRTSNQGDFFTNQPLRVGTQIRNIPPDPGTQFRSAPGQQVALLASNGQPVGDIKTVVHQVHTPTDWQPPPPPDDDCFDSWIHLVLTLFNPFCQEELWLPGDFRVLRGAPSPAGSPTTQEIIDTIIAKALFQGTSVCAGPVAVRLSPTSASLGSVSSLAPAEFFPADSFFDVFFEIDTGIGTLHNTTPTHMNTTVNRLPPEDGEIYFGPGTVIPIYNAGGTLIGEILEVEHKVHQQVVCPAGCKPRIVWPSKTTLDVGIAQGGAGVAFDVVRSSTRTLGSPGATCLQSNGPRLAADATNPATGGVFYYGSRDRFGAFVGSYGSAARDAAAAGVCPP